MMKKKILLSAMTLCMTLCMNAENKIVNVTEAGTLNTLVSETEVTTLTELTVTGNVNENDLGFINTSLTELRTLDLRDAKIDEIPDNAFQANKAITSVVLPASITRIGKNAFEQTHLQTVDFSPCTALTVIDEEAFLSNAYMKDIDLSGLTSLESIKANAFNTCGEAAKLAELGVTETSINLSGCSALTTIEDYGFSNNKCSTSINFGGCSSLIHIGNRVFNNSKVTVVDLKDCTALTELLHPTFNLCTKITDITLPAGLVKMGEKVFPNAGSSLNSVTCLATVPPAIASNSFSATGMGKATLIIPEGCLAAYEANGVWSLFASKEETTSIRTVQTPNAAITVTDRGIEIAGISSGENVTIFNAAGMQVAHTTATGTVSVPLKAKGLYLVRMGENVVKIRF